MSADLIPLPTPQDALPGITTAVTRTPVALTVDPNILAESDFDEWLAVGVPLLLAGDSVPWWIGDWCVAAASRWGQTSQGLAMIGRELAEVTNLEPDTIVGYWHVADKIPPSRRRPELSWSHHVVVANLDADEADELLDLAAEGEFDAVTQRRHRWSVARLRQELRDRRGGVQQVVPGAEAPVRWVVPASVAPRVVPTLRVVLSREWPPEVREVLESLIEVGEAS